MGDGPGDVLCSFCNGSNEEDSVFCVHCGNRLTGQDYGAGAAVLSTGSFIREYRIVRLLGEGGMGQVYEGVQPLTGARVAIKRMNPDLSDNDAVRQRFIEEARVMTLVNHQSIIPIHQFFVDSGRFFLVMKFVEGENLEDVILRSAREVLPFPIDRAVEIGVQMASALSHLHILEARQEILDEKGQSVTRTIRGVIHRDVKPANILLETGGGVYLTDFGIAKAVGRERMTRIGGVVGTYEYMSPEQIQGETVGAASDQYSLAVTIYNLLVGRVPFPQETDGGFDAMEGHMRRDVPPPSQFRQDIPQGVQDALLKALAKDPEDRYESCSAFGDALRSGVGTAPDAVQTVSSDTTVAVAAAPRPSPYLIPGIVGGVLVLGLIAVFASGVFSRGEPKAEAPTQKIEVAQKSTDEKPSEAKTEKLVEKSREAEEARLALAEERENIEVQRSQLKEDRARTERLEAERKIRDADAAAKAKAAAKAGAERRAQDEKRRNHETDCSGKGCGTDRYGASCGTCGGDARCENGVCVRPRPKPSRLAVVKATATNWNYRHKKPSRYGPGNVLDGDLSTAWCKEHGGASITLHLSWDRHIHEVRIRNGYQKIKNDKFGDRFYSNSRVEKVVVRVGNQERTSWATDSKGWQTLADFDGAYAETIEISPKTYHWGPDRSVCISEIEVWGTE